MSETTSESAKPPETPAPPEPAQTWKPPGYDPVDLNTLVTEGKLSAEAVPVIEARFRHLYSQAKSGTEAKKEARELREHLEKLTPVVEQLAAKDTERSKAQVEEEIVRARDEGRVRDELKLQQELSTLNAPKVEAPKPVKTDDYVEAAKGWATETNGDGTLKRPWIDENHPDNVKALGVMHKIRNEWMAKGQDITPQNLPFMLQEIEQRMGAPAPRSTTAAVLSTSQVRPQTKKDEIELNQEQKHVARRLYSNLAPDKAEAAYAKSLQVLRTQGMAR